MGLFLVFAIFPFALDWVELALAEPQVLWRNFEELVVEQEVETLLETELSVWRELNGAIRSVRTHVRELFFTTNININVIFLVTKADNHTLIDSGLWRNIKRTASLGGVEGISSRSAGFK